MNQRVMVVLWLLLAVVPTARGQDQPAEKPPASPAAAYRALVEEYTAAQQAFFAEYRNAKTDEERQKLVQEKYRNPQTFGDRFLRLAQEHADDPAAIDALAWIVQFVRTGPGAEQALKTLREKHLTAPQMAAVCQILAFSATDDGVAVLREVLAKNPHPAAQGAACYGLARALARRGPEQAAESEKLLERVIAEFADVDYGRAKLGKQAEGDLFEIRHLGIGKIAPDIAGEDLDGQPFKLSDYRGKVVLLDFWGHW